MGKLTTHVLDTAHGKPGAHIRIELYRYESVAEKTSRMRLCDVQTNADGRTDQPLLSDAAFIAGEYELVFYAGDYFIAQGVVLPQPTFVNCVTLRFGIADAQQHYHVPLLVSPWSYSTYRGS